MCSGFGHKSQQCESQGRVPYTHQQEESVKLGRRTQQEVLKIKREEPTVKDMLKDGENKLIKEVMEVSPAQSGASHATDLVTLQHIVQI